MINLSPRISSFVKSSVYNPFLKRLNPLSKMELSTVQRPPVSFNGIDRMRVTLENDFLKTVLGAPIRSQLLVGSTIDTSFYSNGRHYINEGFVSWLIDIQSQLHSNKNEAIVFPSLDLIKNLSDDDFKGLVHLILATFSGYDIYGLNYQTVDPKKMTDDLISMGFKPSIFNGRHAVRFDQSALEVKFHEQGQVHSNPSALLNKIDHVVLSLPPELYDLYKALCPDSFWGDVHDPVFSTKIEANQVGMHTEVRVNGDILHPIIFSAPVEVLMVLHFLAPEDNKQATLMVAKDALIQAMNDDAIYLPQYLRDCVDDAGQVDLDKFKRVVWNNQVSRGLHDMNSQLGRGTMLNGFVQHVANLVNPDAALDTVTDLVQFKTPSPPDDYYQISLQCLAQRRLIPILFDYCKIPIQGLHFWYRPELNINNSTSEVSLYDVPFFELFNDLPNSNAIREAVFSWIVRPHQDFDDTLSIRKQMTLLNIPENQINVYLKKMEALKPIFDIVCRISIDDDDLDDIVSKIVKTGITSCKTSDLLPILIAMKEDVLRAKVAGNQLDYELKGSAEETGLLEQRFTSPQQTVETGLIAQFWEILKRCSGDSVDDVLRVCAGFGQLNFKSLMEALQAGIARVDSTTLADALSGKVWPRISTEYILKHGFLNPITQEWALRLSPQASDELIQLLIMLDREVDQRKVFNESK